MGASWCRGSGYVARCAAITDVGGWPMSLFSEDVLCSMLLIGADWRMSYTYEPVQ